MPTRARPVLDVVGERRAQPEIVERRRPKLPDQLIDVAIEPLRRSPRCDSTCARQSARSPHASLSAAIRRRERGQLLAELIVHLARDAPPLVFLREHEARRGVGARPLGLGPLPLGEIEVRADDADDRSARVAADRKSARQHLDVVAVLVAQAELRLRRSTRRASTLSFSLVARARTSSGWSSRSHALMCGSISSSA